MKTKRSSIRIVRLEKFTPATYTILGWEVSDIATTATELAKSGVVFLRFLNVPHDDFGIWTTPDGSRVAWFHDPDGNVLSISQH
ncbi:MAG TPA: hypothetical protein VGD64_13410 [Acidisarcina sp.]